MKNPSSRALGFRAGILLFLTGFVGACPREASLNTTHTNADAGTGAKLPGGDTSPRRRRPSAPGDFRHGWALFAEHCAGCHGSARRGAGMASKGPGLITRPADLRDPILLATRTNDEIADVIARGVLRKDGENQKPQDPKKKEMPAFKDELGEQDMMDLVAFLRGDSIYLEECFPGATHYVRLGEGEGGLAIFGAFGALDARVVEGASVAPGAAPLRPRVVSSASDVPRGTKVVGYVAFVELELPGAGPTPVAFLAEPEGEVHGARAALPEPDNARAERDLEAALLRGVEGAPKLRSIIPAIEACEQEMKAAISALRDP